MIAASLELRAEVDQATYDAGFARGEHLELAELAAGQKYNVRFLNSFVEGVWLDDQLVAADLRVKVEAITRHEEPRLLKFLTRPALICFVARTKDGDWSKRLRTFDIYKDGILYGDDNNRTVTMYGASPRKKAAGYFIK
jgi:hypothetical protein